MILFFKCCELTESSSSERRKRMRRATERRWTSVVREYYLNHSKVHSPVTGWVLSAHLGPNAKACRILCSWHLENNYVFSVSKVFAYCLVGVAWCSDRIFFEDRHEYCVTFE